MREQLESEKIRFILIGLFNTGLDFVMFNFWVFVVGLKPGVGNTLSVIAGITISYLLNHWFVFRSKEPVSVKKYLSFFAVSGMSAIGLQNLIIWGVGEFFKTDFSNSLFLLEQIGNNRGVELNTAKAMAVGIGMIWNFLFYKYVIFKDKPQTPALDVEEEIYE